eukprot:COSAG06_NODE_22772_length_713_cov_0.913681_1_plen_112_part_10
MWSTRTGREKFSEDKRCVITRNAQCRRPERERVAFKRRDAVRCDRFDRGNGRDDRRLRKTKRLCFSVSLCLSRACLGTKIVSVLKWLPKERRFPHQAVGCVVCRPVSDSAHG